MSGERRALLSRPLVRLASAVVATGVLGLALWAAGLKAVLSDIGTAVHVLPTLTGLEAVMVACSTVALRTLYGATGSVVPLREWLRVGAAGYAVGLVLPMGRSSGEAVRAVILGRIVGGARAAVAAVQMQALTLLSTAVFALPILVATLVYLPPGLMAGFIVLNTFITASVGLALLVLRQRASPGRRLGGLFKRLEPFGAAFDAAASASRGELVKSLAWETGGRVTQVVQCAVVLSAFGQPSGLLRDMATRGALMVGSAIGDILPGQFGATEATLVAGAAALGLTAASAASLALLIHGAQIVLGLLCAALSFLRPGGRRAGVGEAEAAP
ncbi:MAG: lysylphosphatidylglycerol synthase domain-containing protein [Myxococcaceae bacterium]